MATFNALNKSKQEIEKLASFSQSLLEPVVAGDNDGVTVYDASNRDMKTQAVNSASMVAYARKQFPNNADMLETVINLSTYCRLKQIAETGKMGEYDPSYARLPMALAKELVAPSEENLAKIEFALKYIGQANPTITEYVPKEWTTLVNQATEAKDAVHKRCFTYIRREMVDGVHLGKTQEPYTQTHKEVTPEQYATAIYAHGFDANTTKILLDKMDARINPPGKREDVCVGYRGVQGDHPVFEQQWVPGKKQLLTTTALYLDIMELGLKSDKFAFNKSLDEHGAVIPDSDGKGFANNGFKILPQDYAIFAASIINVDLFSRDKAKVRASIQQLDGAATEQQPNGAADVIHITEAEGWNALAKDLFAPEYAKRFIDIQYQNYCKALAHERQLKKVTPTMVK